MWFAGLYDGWHNPQTGEVVTSFTVIIKWGQAILVTQFYKEVIRHVVQAIATAHVRIIAQECWQLGVAHRGVLE